MDRMSECREAQGSAGATDGQDVRVSRSTGRARATVRPSLPRIAPGMAQASLSTAARPHLLRASRDDGQDVRSGRPFQRIAPGIHASRDVPTSL